MRPAALLLALLGTAACGRPAGVTARWEGADTGEISVPATARWCDSAAVLELLAVQGDTGVALALYVDSLVPDSVPVREIETGARRPWAAVGFRSLDASTMSQMRGTGGWVLVDAAEPARIRGRFEAQLRPVRGPLSTRLEGRFDVPLERPAAGCAGDGSDTADAGVS